MVKKQTLPFALVLGKLHRSGILRRVVGTVENAAGLRGTQAGAGGPVVGGYSTAMTENILTERGRRRW